jgi:hypothetical protein
MITKQKIMPPRHKGIKKRNMKFKLLSKPGESFAEKSER